MRESVKADVECTDVATYLGILMVCPNNLLS